MTIQKTKIKAGWDLIQSKSHAIAKASGWWSDGVARDKNIVPLKLSLVHSEISEALEGYRKNLSDEHLPHRSAIECELADAIIRIADLGDAMGLDIGGAIANKMEYNQTRPDHKLENRIAGQGKQF